MKMKSEAVVSHTISHIKEYECNSLVASSEHLGWNNLLVEQFNQPSGQCETHYPTEHTICLCLASRPIQLFQMKEGLVNRALYRKGDISITPAQVSALDKWVGEDHCLRIRLSAHFIEKVATEALEMDSSRINLISEFQVRDPHIEHIGMTLLSELNNEGVGKRLYVESLANVLAVHLLRNYSTFVPRVSLYRDGLLEQQLVQVIEYINEYLGQDVKLSDLAGLLDMSQFYFVRRFKQSMGISPHQYIIQQRVERAKQLLLCSELSIAEVALRCGFNSQSHLGKWFRQLTKVTPSAYRQQ